MSKFWVYYDSCCTGWYSNHGPYTARYDAELMAKELVRRKGGQCKILLRDTGLRLFLGHVGALESWGDGCGVFNGFRCPFDPAVHEWFGKYDSTDDSTNLPIEEFTDEQR